MMQNIRLTPAKPRSWLLVSQLPSLSNAIQSNNESYMYGYPSVCSMYHAWYGAGCAVDVHAASDWR